MSTGIHRRIRFHSKDRRKVLIQESANEETLPGRIPRVARLMALAIRMEALIASGRVACYADAARLAHVSRARMTQIMNLTRLAPDIQVCAQFSLCSVPLAYKAGVAHSCPERRSRTDMRQLWT